jgi:hypothetical protein
MAPEPENYWGGGFAGDSKSVPKSILAEQAQILGRLTGNRIVGDVEQSTAGSEFVIRLVLHVPSIDYRYELLTVVHGIHLYPLRLTSHANPNSHAQQCKTEADFRDALRATLASPKTKQIVEALMAQAAA